MTLTRTFRFRRIGTTNEPVTVHIEHRPALKQVELEVSQGKNVRRDKRKFDSLNDSAAAYVRLINKPLECLPPGFELV